MELSIGIVGATGRWVRSCALLDERISPAAVGSSRGDRGAQAGLPRQEIEWKTPGGRPEQAGYRVVLRHGQPCRRVQAPRLRRRSHGDRQLVGVGPRRAVGGVSAERDAHRRHLGHHHQRTAPPWPRCRCSRFVKPDWCGWWSRRIWRMSSSGLAGVASWPGTGAYASVRPTAGV